MRSRSRYAPVALVLALLALAGLVAVARDDAGPGRADATPVIVVEPVESRASISTSTPRPTTTLDPAVPTTTVRPPAEHETFVATIMPEVTEITPLTEPGGTEPTELEFRVTNPTYFDNPLVLMVTDRTPDGEWLKVQIPVRPNGTEGWIPAAQAEVTSHFVRAQVDLTNRSVRVWDGDDLMAETGAVIGAAATPTPVGTFFVNDLVEKWNGSAYGPYILSLSAFSETLETFGGGVPVIAIHGTNKPELIGGAHSNGCIRIPNAAIEFLAAWVPMGTPVEIIA